jgi:kynureninase
VLLPAVLYRSGQLLDMERLTRAAHERSILIGFDCCHSAGAVPHRLHDWGVDFAFWCNYKYLNGGPGSVATLFVHERHFGRLPGLTGWFGCNKDKQFDMELTFHQAAGAGAWQISTPNLFSAAPLYGALKIHTEAGIEAIRAKSLDQTGYLMFLIDSVLAPYGFSVGNPPGGGTAGRSCGPGASGRCAHLQGVEGAGDHSGLPQPQCGEACPCGALQYLRGALADRGYPEAHHGGKAP